MAHLDLGSALFWSKAMIGPTKWDGRCGLVSNVMMGPTLGCMYIAFGVYTTHRTAVVVKHELTCVLPKEEGFLSLSLSLCFLTADGQRSFGMHHGPPSQIRWVIWIVHLVHSQGLTKTRWVPHVGATVRTHKRRCKPVLQTQCFQKWKLPADMICVSPLLSILDIHMDESLPYKAGISSKERGRETVVAPIPSFSRNWLRTPPFEPTAWSSMKPQNPMSPSSNRPIRTTKKLQFGERRNRWQSTINDSSLSLPFSLAAALIDPIELGLDLCSHCLGSKREERRIWEREGERERDGHAFVAPA